MTLGDVDHRHVRELRAALTGDVLLPGDAGYDATRAVFNTAIDRRPAVIVLCETSSDVAHAVRYARSRDLEIAVRGGGHGVAGRATVDGGLVVDLRRMRAVTVDPQARTATVAGGATMRDLDLATAQFGLATTGGRVSTTGVGGLLLGGGTGWLDRSLGLLCDHLVSAELVTANGSLVRTSAEEDGELFWALHGGGGNFGVVTSCTVGLHPLREVTAALLVSDPRSGPDVVERFRDVVEAAPPALSGAVQFHTAPDKPFVPEHLAGSRACTVLVVYAGVGAEARDAIAPMLDLPDAGRLVLEIPYVELQCLLDDPPGYRNYWSTDYLDELPGDAVRAFCAASDRLPVPSPSAQVLVPLGGAVAERASDYPLPWRRARWQSLSFGMWADPAGDEPGRSWVRGVRTALDPWTTGQVYLNFVGDEAGDRVVAGLGPDNLARLARVKRRLDPDNAFHLNHNIPPA